MLTVGQQQGGAVGADPPPPAMPPPSGSAVATRFATYWVVDAIASDESLDFSMLMALVDAYSVAASGDVAATAAGVPRVDGARSCQDVLFQLAREAGTGKFEKDLLAPFSRDIQEAIRTTEFTLPETSIQLILAMDLRMEDVLGAAEAERRPLNRVKGT